MKCVVLAAGRGSRLFSRYRHAVTLSRLRKRYLPLSSSTLALWAWRYRHEVIDWAAFGVRAALSLVNGNTDDVKAEARLRLALEKDRRTRHVPGLEVIVSDGTGVLNGIVDRKVHGRAVKIAKRTKGIKKVNDRLEETRRK